MPNRLTTRPHLTREAAVVLALTITAALAVAPAAAAAPKSPAKPTTRTVSGVVLSVARSRRGLELVSGQHAVTAYTSSTKLARNVAPGVTIRATAAGRRLLRVSLTRARRANSIEFAAAVTNTSQMSRREVELQTAGTVINGVTFPSYVWARVSPAVTVPLAAGDAVLVEAPIPYRPWTLINGVRLPTEVVVAVTHRVCQDTGTCNPAPPPVTGFITGITSSSAGALAGVTVQLADGTTQTLSPACFTVGTCPSPTAPASDYSWTLCQNLSATWNSAFNTYLVAVQQTATYTGVCANDRPGSESLDATSLAGGDTSGKVTLLLADGTVREMPMSSSAAFSAVCYAVSVAYHTDPAGGLYIDRISGLRPSTAGLCAWYQRGSLLDPTSGGFSATGTVTSADTTTGALVLSTPQGPLSLTDPNPGGLTGYTVGEPVHVAFSIAAADGTGQVTSIAAS